MPRFPKPRPGDYLLERYLPGANEETQDEARKRFLAHARFLERVGARLFEEEGGAVDSREGTIGAILDEAPQEPPP